MAIDGEVVAPDDALEAAGAEDGADEDDSIAPPTKKSRKSRVWEIIGEWDLTAERDDFVDAEIIRIANEKMAEGGIRKLRTFKHSDTDLGYWKERDRHSTPGQSTLIIRYRCPLSVRCKCPALLRLTKTSTRITLEQSEMHKEDDHSTDNSKFLTWQQRESVVRAVSVAPLSSGTAIRRSLSRTSPDKSIDAEKQRYCNGVNTWRMFH